MDKVKIPALVTLIIVLVAATVYTSLLRYRELPQSDPPTLEDIPLKKGSYEAVEEYLEPESLRLLGADTTLARSYRSPVDEIEFFLGYFARQQENSQIHSPKHCYPGSGWNIIGERGVEVNVTGGKIGAKELVISDGRERHLVIYWFNMSGTAIPNEFALKFHQMKNALLSRSQSAAFIRFSTAIKGNSESEARTRLLGFIGEISPDIRSALSSGNESEGK